MKFVLATHNRHKIVEMSDILNEVFTEKGMDFGVKLLSADDMGFTDEPDETGSTFEENARIKAMSLSDIGYISIADDSGLSVDALDGEPGVYSARYSGGDDSDNIKLLLKRLEDVSDKDRTAHFICAVCCVMPNGDVIEAVGRCDGVILRSPVGNDGFGYDPVFYYPPLKKTLAELTSKEKNAVSHRRNALTKFAELFSEYIADKGIDLSAE